MSRLATTSPYPPDRLRFQLLKSRLGTPVTTRLPVIFSPTVQVQRPNDDDHRRVRRGVEPMCAVSSKSWETVEMPAEALLRPKRSSLPPREGQKVLIIDDDEAIAEPLAFRLQRQGFHTLIAGEAGLALARSERPSIVLLDLRLPDIDGFTVCEQLDSDPTTCHIPVIILSGMERPDIIRRARAAGCTYFVRKPYDPNALLILIQSATSPDPGGHAHG
jgi:CheY-like chemotaxis protein